MERFGEGVRKPERTKANTARYANFTHKEAGSNPGTPGWSTGGLMDWWTAMHSFQEVNVLTVPHSSTKQLSAPASSRKGWQTPGLFLLEIAVPMSTYVLSRYLSQLFFKNSICRVSHTLESLEANR